MTRPPQPREPLSAPSLTPDEGWHCSHYCYRFRRGEIGRMERHAVKAGRTAFLEALDPNGNAAPERLQGYITAGHKADFIVMLMDPDPLKIDAVHQALLAGPLGAALEPTWSFVSVSEVSEYVPSVEQYRNRLIADGAEPESPETIAKVNAYEKRLPMMNQQRLAPEFPDLPAACFYPMNKSRVVGANWFTEPFSVRNALMAEHARSGMAFAGRVSQLITVGVGLDDWEWMVTLWGRNPQYLKDIVYKMRFDKASAKYAEFGPFFTGYKATPLEILDHCRVV